jgi:NAD+ diphosphatase
MAPSPILEGPGLERLEHRRGEPGVLGPGTRVVVVSGSRALLIDGAIHTDRLGALDIRHEPELGVGDEPELGVGHGPELDVGSPGDTARPIVFLGERDGVRYAARAVTAVEADALERETGGRFESLRSVVATLPGWQGGLLAYAAALLAWHRESRYCGACGAPTRVRQAGHQRVCSLEGCGAVVFPRTDPAIITLLRHEEAALLVHQPSWPAGRFSTLAGFVEPGESLEQAVAREVAEEVGLVVDRVAYYASQPWPFPHTLMVGYRTEVADRAVTLGDEVDDARWFDRAGLRAALEAGEITIPPPLSLSRSLIDDWLEDE